MTYLSKELKSEEVSVCFPLLLLSALPVSL